MTIQLPTNSTGTIVDTATLGGKDRELVVLAGDGAVAEVAGVVLTQPAETEYGLITRGFERVDGETLSTANLGISGVFTGAWNDANADGVAFVEAAAFADEVSAASGFVIEGSDDSSDSNFTRTLDSFTVIASTLATIQAAVPTRFWRVKYTNGGTAQASFRLTAAARNRVVPAVDSAGQAQVDVLTLPANASVDVAQIAGTATSVNTGTRDAGTQRVTVATDDLVPISAASLPLPAGAATSALQLTDGHNVTVDNTIAAPANVQLSDGTDTAVISAAGELVVKPEGASVDSNNSTSTPLGVSGVFTGTLTDVTKFGSISIQVFADQTSATDGLSFEWSTDGGSNWDIKDQHTITINQGEQFILPRVAESFRIVYTNGGTGQGIFRLETILNAWPVSGEVEELDVALDSKDLALTTRSVIAGENPSNDFVNVQVTGAGNFKVAIEEAEGGIQGGGTEATALRVTMASDSTGVLTVDGSGVTQPVSAASLPLPAGAATSALQLVDGHNVTVDNGAAGAAVNIQDGGNTITVDGTVSVDLNSSTNTIEVVGDAAHGASVAGNPLLTGAEARTTLPTAVTDGQAVRVQADDQGRLVTAPFSPRDLVVQGRVALTSTTETTVLALDASNFHDLVLATLTNESGTAVRVDIRDSTAGTIRESMFLAADGGGAVIPFPATLPQAATNNNWTAQLSAAVTSVYVTLVAVKRA